MNENLIKLDGDYVTREVHIIKEGKLKFLSPARSQKIRNHSPDGFNWGYGGSGPAQLALAICLHYFLDESKSLEVYQDFKFKVIAALPQSDFSVTIDMDNFKII